MVQITNKGRRWIQHGDNHIILTNIPSITNFQITATIHLPILADGDITVRGPQHSSPTPTGFAAGSMINITTRPNTENNGVNTIFYMAHIRLNGGYGFTIGGANNLSCLPRRERFDDVAQTQTVRSSGLIFNKTSAFSLNGLGYQLGGEFPIGGTVSGSTRRFDDVLNDANVRTSITARNGLATYTINGYGFTSCGFDGTNRTGLTERFDDYASTNVARTSATARDLLAGFGMNNYGFTAGGETAGGIIVGNIERFNDITNTQTARIAAATSGALAGNSMNGYGFVYGGENPVATNINTVNRFDDITNSTNGRTGITTRRLLTAYSLNGFGFTSGGFIAAVTGTTQRFDDVANTHTAVTSLSSPRSGLGGYASNEYFVNYDTLEP